MVVLFYPCTFIAIKQLQSNSYLYSPLGLLIETIIKGIELQKKVKKKFYIYLLCPSEGKYPEPRRDSGQRHLSHPSARICHTEKKLFFLLLPRNITELLLFYLFNNSRKPGG